MKIVLDIPDEYKDQRLTLVAGNRELVAKKLPFEDFWIVKIVRCNMCGECCLGGGFPKDFPFPIDEEGHCTMLDINVEGKEWLCKAKYTVPFICMTDPLIENVPHCCIRYERQPGEKTI